MEKKKSKTASRTGNNIVQSHANRGLGRPANAAIVINRLLVQLVRVLLAAVSVKVKPFKVFFRHGDEEKLVFWFKLRKIGQFYDTKIAVDLTVQTNVHSVECKIYT